MDRNIVVATRLSAVARDEFRCFVELFTTARRRFEMQKIRFLGALCASVLVIAAASPARAEAWQVGRLVCFSSVRVGVLVGSTQSLRCAFQPRGASSQYIYEGRIRRVGLDIGVTGGGTLSWAVLARNSRIGPATLRGSYVGASGNVALGPGFGANVLIGGSRRTIALQPLSVERGIGVNLAVGVTNLTLTQTGRRQLPD